MMQKRSSITIPFSNFRRSRIMLMMEVILITLLRSPVVVNGQNANRTYSSVQCRLNTERTIYIQYDPVAQRFREVYPEAGFRVQAGSSKNHYINNNNNGRRRWLQMITQRKLETTMPAAEILEVEDATVAGSVSVNSGVKGGGIDQDQLYHIGHHFGLPSNTGRDDENEEVSSYENAHYESLAGGYNVDGNSNLMSRVADQNGAGRAPGIRGGGTGTGGVLDIPSNTTSTIVATVSETIDKDEDSHATNNQEVSNKVTTTSQEEQNGSSSSSSISSSSGANNPIYLVRTCWCSQYFGNRSPKNTIYYCPVEFNACRVDGSTNGPITCFHDSNVYGSSSFIRGFWFISLFWFVALLYAFFFSEQGNSARSYIRRKVCLRLYNGNQYRRARRNANAAARRRTTQSGDNQQQQAQTTEGGQGGNNSRSNTNNDSSTSNDDDTNNNNVGMPRTELEQLNLDIDRMLRTQPDRVAWLLRSAFLRHRSRQHREFMSNLGSDSNNNGNNNGNGNSSSNFFRRFSLMRRRNNNNDSNSNNNNDNQNANSQQQQQTNNDNDGNDVQPSNMENAINNNSNNVNAAVDDPPEMIVAPAFMDDGGIPVMTLRNDTPQPNSSSATLQLKVKPFVLEDSVFHKKQEKKHQQQQQEKQNQTEEQTGTLEGFDDQAPSSDAKIAHNDVPHDDESPQEPTTINAQQDKTHQKEEECEKAQKDNSGGSSIDEQQQQEQQDQQTLLHHLYNFDFNFEEEDDEVCCAICLIPLEEGDLIGNIPCGHVFHKECLKMWLKRKNHCPLCQRMDIATLKVSVSTQQQQTTQQQQQQQQEQQPTLQSSFLTFFPNFDP